MYTHNFPEVFTVANVFMQYTGRHRAVGGILLSLYAVFQEQSC
jgi:hypothetical protein